MMNKIQLSECRVDNLKKISEITNTLACVLNVILFENKDLQDKKKIKKYLMKISGVVSKANMDLLNYLEKMNDDISKIIEGDNG